MTNSERRISLLRQDRRAARRALADAVIFSRLARKMGFSGFDQEDPADIFREHALLTAGTSIDISGLDYATLRARRSYNGPTRQGSRTGVRQDCLPITGFILLRESRFSFRRRRGAQRTADPDFPLILTTGRIRDQWHTMTKTGKVNKLKQHIPQAFFWRCIRPMPGRWPSAMATSFLSGQDAVKCACR